MKAAGLSLDDVLGTSNGDLPPYRFVYLIEKAKALASTLAGFGASLLASLEKKDAEDLNQLRLTQQMNLAQLMTQTRQMEIDAAQAALDGFTQQLMTAQDRSAHYQQLLSNGLNRYEQLEATLRNEVALAWVAQQEVAAVASLLSLIPQAGSPFAMTFGGVQEGGSMHNMAFGAAGIASVDEACASADALQASFARRTEEWQFQKQMADDDVKTLTKQQTAAQIRLDIANAALTLHQNSLDQMQDYIDRNSSKFTKVGLYVWLSGQLQTTYRGAFQNALALANLAEQAFRFERGDYTSPGLATSYWDPTHAGLLAGEGLLADLQTLERRFIETNYRTLEVDQAFALSQIDAGALLDLRENGKCAFGIPEVFFDLYYPGQYKRRIKAVRLTIPCVTGPYVNVSATLDLTASQVRTNATTGQQALVDVPPTRSVSVAASTAQNDAGVFELSFRDERYMPFEGLGAVNSAWRLTLPTPKLRQFDYQTINDVILSISYLAEQDQGAFREAVEGSGTQPGTTLSWFQNNTVKRVFSLRQDFSSAFSRLLRSPAGTVVNIEITDRSFPFFMQGQTLHVQPNSAVLLRAANSVTPGAFAMTMDGQAVSGFAAGGSRPGGLPGQPLPGSFGSNLRAQHSITISNAGGFAPPSPPPPGDVSAVDSSKLLDVLIYVEYRLG
jgi:hypothetical protein